MIHGWGLAHPEAAQMIEGRFDELSPRASRTWTAYVSPPFPGEWPPDENRSVVHYGYAVSPVAGRSDAIWICSPFARVVVPPEDLPFAAVTEPPFLEALLDQLIDFGMQTVQPLRPDQVEIVRTQDDAMLEMRNVVEGSLAADRAETLVKFQLHWTSVLSTVAAAIRPNHRSWFAWLGRQALTRSGMRPLIATIIDSSGREHRIDPFDAFPPSEIVLGSGADATMRIAGAPAELASIVLGRDEYWMQPLAGTAVADRVEQSSWFPLRDKMKISIGRSELVIRLGS